MHKVLLSARAEKQLDKLTGKDFERIVTKLQSLRKNPRPTNAVKLVVRHLGDYRIRQGDCRIRYDIDDSRKQVLILDISSRDKAY